MPKRLALGFLALSLAVSAIECPGPAYAKAVPPPSERMASWYQGNGWEANEGFVLFCGQETERFAALLGIEAHVPTLLSMWHRESAYTVVAGDDGQSYGVTQTLRRWENHWREFWLGRGIELGSLDDPSTQIAFGVAEFSECLKYAKGDVDQAIGRYNGGKSWHKKKAQRYVGRVLKTRKLVFGE